LKRLYIIICFFFFSTIILAQPANDNCTGAQLVTPNGSCNSGTTVGANDSWQGSAGCQTGGNHPDVWYTFTSTGSQAQFTITTSSPWSGNVELILVQGTCAGGFTIVGSQCGPSPLNTTLTGLQNGTTYYYTISTTSTGIPGPFQTCLTTTTPPTSAGQDCNNAAILCNSNTFSQSTSNAGFGTQEVTTANSCWGGGGERQSKWFKFTIGCSGTLEFNIKPINLGDDYDWALWNITSDPTGCATKGNSIACNWSGCMGSTGLSSCITSEPGVQNCGASTGGDPCGSGNRPRAWGNWSAPGAGLSNCISNTINVVAGNTYALLVDNFTTSNSGFTLTFGGACNGGTAKIGPNADFTYTVGTCGTYNFIKTCPTTNSTFLWQFGDGTTSSVQNPSHTYTTFGNFVITLQVTDALGCVVTFSRTINIVATAVTVNSPTICAGQSATLIATPSTGGGTYSWSPGGATTQSITVSPASTTTYTVTYTLAGCPGTGSGTVTVNAAPTVTVNSPTICAGQSATLTATPSAGGGTYSWSPGGATIQSITVSPASTTTYTVTYTLAGCPGTGSGTVTVNAAPTVTVNSPTICAGQNATLTATPSTGGGTYSWSPGGATTQSITVSPASTTTYTVTYTLAGCPGTGSGTVTVNAAPSVTVNSPTICAGQSATLTATPSTGGGTYSWSPGGATTQSITVSPVSTTTYTVTYNLSGCSNTATGTVTVNTVTPFVSIIASSTSICSGNSITFTATPANGGTTPTYQWKINGVNVAGQTASTFTSTTLANGDAITVVMTSNDPCANPVTATSNTVTITATSVVPSVAITTSSTSICSGNSVTFTAIPANGGTTPTYQWKINGVNVAGQTASTFTSTTLANGDAITVVMTSNDPCANPVTAASNTVTITATSVTPSVVIAASSTSICSGNSVTFTATPANGGTTPTYQWKINGVNVAGQTASTFTSTTLVNGDAITVVMTSNDPCANPVTAASNTVTITATSVTPSVAITASSTSICSGNSVTFTVTPANGGTTPTYQWKINGVNVAGQTASTFTSTTLANGDAITVVMTSNDPCANPVTAASNIITITSAFVTPSVAISSNTTSICSGNSIIFTATPVNGGTAPAYQWKINGVNVAGQTTSTFTSTTFANGDAITVVMTSNDPCANPVTAASNTVTITSTSVLSGIRYPTVTAIPNTSLPLHARTLGNNYTYQWIPPVGLDFPNIKDPIFTYDKRTEYIIKITSATGCETTDTLLVEINNPVTGNDPYVFVPNVWTPNGDGHNDYLFPFMVNITQLKYFRIYNRWGQKVFETSIPGRGWDGMFRGNPQVMDVYTWTIEALANGGYIYKRIGKAALLR
jgi:gliding motility-associated-like protein